MLGAPVANGLAVAELIRASAMDIGTVLSSLKAPLDELRSTMQELARTAVPGQIESITQAALAPMRARVEEALGGFDQRLAEVRQRIAALDGFLTEERASELVQVETRQVAGRIQEDLQVRLLELQEAFEDADDRYGKIKKLIDSFNPGGLAVLHQENTALRETLSRREQDLGKARSSVQELEEKVAQLERELLRLRLTQGASTLEELEKRRKELSEQESELRGREILEAENQRLVKQREELNEELEQWRKQDRAEQRYEIDKKELEELREARTEAASDKERLERTRAKTERERNELKRRVDALEAQLAEGKQLQEVAQKREARLERLEQEREILLQTRDDARVERDEQRHKTAELDRKVNELLRKLSEEQSRAARLEVEREEALRQRETQVSKAVRENLRKEFGDWAEDQAQSRAARAITERDAALQECKRLQDRLSKLEQELRDAKAHNKQLETQSAMDQASLEVQRQRIQESASDELNRARAKGAELLKVAEERKASVQQQAQEESSRVQSLRDESQKFARDLAALTGEIAARQAERDSLLKRIDELTEKVRSRDDRLKQLVEPLFSQAELPPLFTEVPAETDWLARVEQGLKDAGFRFHSRLVHAFHTSLKVAQSSPLTILAGISGTGKSELPRLYADLGGLSFLPVAVQPGWDSPSDLLGFFNYTDGRLKADPLARLLYQVNAEGSRLREGLSIVLLDEMNLARVEYYFSELLSKLEARRGVGGVPDRKRASVSIDLGAGETQELLYLDERVLFVGTMNEDESTHTLSDKVLDRSCLLSFPSPRNMRLEKQGHISRSKERLPFETWKQWCGEKRSSEAADTLNEINDIMERVGRPFGHRLFRAIHTYIAQYPGSTLEARDHAWSDQWAMKILPRLKGLECEARRVREGLDALARHLPAELTESFEQARREDYFAWRGAAELYRIAE